LKKLLRNYRLSPKTVQQIGELSTVLGELNATAVVSQAIQEKHDRFLKENGTRLSLRRDGKYDVIKRDLKIAVIEASQVRAMPESKRNEFLGQGILHGEVELILDVAAGRGKKIKIDQENWNMTVPKKK
jgi:hypothetical protein